MNLWKIRGKWLAYWMDDFEIREILVGTLASDFLLIACVCLCTHVDFEGEAFPMEL